MTFLIFAPHSTVKESRGIAQWMSPAPSNNRSRRIWLQFQSIFVNKPVAGSPQSITLALYRQRSLRRKSREIANIRILIGLQFF